MKVAVPTPRPTSAARKSLGSKPALRLLNGGFDPGKLSRFASPGSPLTHETELHRSRRVHNRFQLNALVAQILFLQLHEHAEAQYEIAQNGKHRFLQTGLAWQSFSSLFEPLSAIELVRLFENLLRFANDESYAPARGFFLAYAPLSFEHDVSGEFIGPGVWTPQAGSRAAALRVRRTLKRWCEWLEALVHFQVHQLHCAASPCIDLDKAIILLWPLLKRYRWGYQSFLTLLQAHTHSETPLPFISATQFAAYCRDSLRLNAGPQPRPLSGSFSGQVAARRILKFLPLMH